MTLFDSKSSRLAHLATLDANRIDPGVHRAHVISVLAKLAKGAKASRNHVFTCAFDGWHAPFSALGPITEKEVVSEDGKTDIDGLRAAREQRVYVHPDLVSRSAVGDLPTNKVVKVGGTTLTIPTGVCAIIGGSGTGKTPLAHLLADSGVDDYGIVTVGEAFIGYDVDRRRTAERLGSAMIAYPDVVLDSIKDLLSSGGNLMKSGLSRSAIIEMSVLSILASSLGVTVYVPVNPSDDSPEVIAVTKSAVRSSVACTIVIGDNGNCSFEAKTGEGRERNIASFVFDREAPANAPAGKTEGLRMTHGVGSSTVARLEQVRQSLHSVNPSNQ